MRRLFLAISFVMLAWPSVATATCPTGSTCETFQSFSGVIKLVATGVAATDTSAMQAAIAACGPNTSVSFVGIMKINAPIGDPQVGCEVNGFDIDEYDGGAGWIGGSALQAVPSGSWIAGSAVLGSNDGVTYQHFVIDGASNNTGNCVNVHNVRGFTALYVHAYQCLIGWNILSDGNDHTHSQATNQDIQIWNGIEMRDGLAGIKTSVLNGGSNNDIQIINNTLSQNGNSPSVACNTTEPGNVAVFGGTSGFIFIGSRDEDAFCPGNHAWDIENANRVTIFGAQSDMLEAENLYINNSTNISIVGTEYTQPDWNGTFQGLGPFVRFAGTIDRLVMFGGFEDSYGGANACEFIASTGSVMTNSALYDVATLNQTSPPDSQTPGKAKNFCDTNTSTLLTPFFVSTDQAFP